MFNTTRMGIETGSERTKKLYERYFSNKQIEEATKVINKFAWKSPPRYDVILDNPWETDDDLIETLDLLLRIPKPYDLNLFSLTLYPGTKLYEKGKKEGLITDDLNDVYRKNYRAIKPSYLNQVFYLVSLSKAPRWILRLLINKKIMRLRLHLLLYLILQLEVNITKSISFIGRVIKVLFTGDFEKIRRWISILTGRLSRYNSENYYKTKE